MQSWHLEALLTIARGHYHLGPLNSGPKAALDCARGHAVDSGAVHLSEPTHPTSSAGGAFSFNTRPASGGNPRDILLHRKPADAPYGTRAAGELLPHKLERVHRPQRVPVGR